MEKTGKIFRTDVTEGILLREEGDLVFTKDKEGSDGEEQNILNVYDQVRYQEIEGFGGAFTEASAVNFQKLSEEHKEEVLTAYFDAEKGNGYRFCRTTINSCDFSTEIYSYDDTPGDYELHDFTIERDKKYVIPMIRAAQERAEGMKLFASPWSPPAWMKTNGRMDKGGSLKKDCREVWARFTARYLEEYEKEGIPIWGVTIQNEAKAEQGWESCAYSADEERDFVTGYLKPAYEKAGLGDKKILFWDHNKERIVDRSLTTLCNDRSRAAFDGIALHWYSGDHFDALSVTHDLFPEKPLYATEACVARDEQHPWASGETYAHDMIGDLNHWVSAWTDWNMLLDEEGGPDHWKDEQFDTGWDKEKIWEGESPIMILHKEGKLRYASSYYYIGHFSRFIKPGARRIGSSVFTGELENCAFINPDGTKAVVVLNRQEKAFDINVRFHDRIAKCHIGAHQIVTIVF